MSAQISIVEHERYRLILDVATEGFWDWDLKSDRAYLSPRYCQLVGYSPEETVFDSRFFRSIIHPDDRDQVFRIIGEHLQGRRDLSVIEYRMISRDGTVRWIEGRGRIVEYDGDGNPTRIVGTIVDISERKRCEEKFHFLASKLPDMVVARFDRDLRHLYVNASVEKVTGQPREYFIGKSNRELGMPDDLVSLWDDVLNAVWESGQARQMEFSFPGPGGGVINYESQVIPELAADGAVSSVICISRDVSRRRETERMLQESEEKFRMAFEGASDAIFWADADSGTLINCNRAAERMLELPRGEIIGRHQTFLHPPEMAELFANQFKRTVAQHKEIDNAEAIVISRSGRRIPVHIKHSVTSVGGRNIMQGLFRDVTEQKRTEEALRQSHALLNNLSRQVPGVLFQTVISPDGHICTPYSSEKLQDIYELKPAQIREDVAPLFQRFHPEDHDRVIASITDATERLTKWECEYRVLLPRRGLRWLYGVALPQKMADGTVVFYGIIMDISERIRAEENLAELNRKLRALSDHLQTVQERERLAIARDFHDEIGQNLTVLKLDLEWIEHRLPAAGDDLRERMGEMRSNIEQLTLAVQRIAADLRPPLLDSLGLAAAIEWQLAEFGRRSGIECFAMLNEDVAPLDQQVSTAVMRIVQEGLTNVLRHARATEVSVSLCKRDGQLVLEIGDNGRGIRPEEIVSPRAYGLIGMQERARICGGELRIRGAAEGGTLLHLTIPLKEGEQSS